MATKSKSKKIRAELTISRPQLMVDGSDRAFRQFLHDTLAFSARLQAVRGQLGAVIGLSVDEAHYLLYAVHPALSYFDHPPLVGWVQWPLVALGRPLACCG